MVFILAILAVIISGNFGYYYYPPSPFGISQNWPPQQRYQNSNYYGYNSMPFASNSRNPTFSSSSNYFHQRAQYCADLRLFREANYLIEKAGLNQTDFDSIIEIAKTWNIEGIKNEIYDLVNNKFDINDRNRSLELLDILSPPRSFTDAIEVLTVEQKSHIQDLFKTSRYQDLSIVVKGLIKSLPDEDQRKARRFVQAIRYISQQQQQHFSQLF